MDAKQVALTSFNNFGGLEWFHEWASRKWPQDYSSGSPRVQVETTSNYLFSNFYEQ